MLHLHLVEQPSAPIRSLSTAREWRTGWRPGKRPSHPQLMRTILWNKSYCWLLCNLPLQSAIKLLLCFFCSSSAFLRHAISSRKQNCCSAPSMTEAWLSSWGAWGRPRGFLQKKKLNCNITSLQFFVLRLILEVLVTMMKIKWWCKFSQHCDPSDSIYQ